MDFIGPRGKYWWNLYVKYFIIKKHSQRYSRGLDTLEDSGGQPFTGALEYIKFSGGGKVTFFLRPRVSSYVHEDTNNNICQNLLIPNHVNNKHP